MYAISIASKRSGVGIEAIRYYEREGVVPSPARASNGRRVYEDVDIARLRFVRRCRELGFSIKHIKVLLSLSYSMAPNCDDANEIGTFHLKEVRAKIADLQMLETAMIELLANCADGQARCPMLLQLFDE